MIWAWLIILAALFVAYANGANDNFKGVATLFGSGTADYRKALAWATITTFVGSLTAFFFAAKLIKTFSGKGLVPDALAADPRFLLAVALAVSWTVIIATLTGIPISTTHSLMGALVGAGLVAIGPHLGWSTLGRNFFIPLLLSPFLAIVLTLFVYSLLRFSRLQMGIGKNTCVCMGKQTIAVPSLVNPSGHHFTVAEPQSFGIVVDDTKACQAISIERYSGQLVGVDVQKILDGLHFISAGAVCFARGLNDTPKIVAIALAAGIIGLKVNIILVAVMMALGGILNAKRVAQIMSDRITKMNHGQGLSANFITSLLVILASWLGLPVSTTHVSCGSLFGIGLVNGKANWKTIKGILSAWVLTLPISALFAGIFYSGFRMIKG